MPCCALVNRDKKMSENFSCNQRRYDTNCMCRLLFCEINRALSHSFAHNERISSWWSLHVTLATFATSTRTFYTVIVVLIIFYNFSLTRHDHLSHTLFVFFFTNTYVRQKQEQRNAFLSQGLMRVFSIWKLEHIHGMNSKVKFQTKLFR